MAVLDVTTPDPGHRVAGPEPKPAGRSLLPDVWTLRVADDLVAFAIGVAVAGRTAGAFAYAAVGLLALVLAGSYRRQLVLSVLDEVGRLVQCLGVALVAVGAVSAVVTIPGNLPAQAAATAVALVLGRAAAYAVVRRARRLGLVGDRTVVVGAGSVGLEILRVLDAHPEYGLVPVGVVDDVPDEPGLPLLGSLADLQDVIAHHGIDRVIVAFGPTGEQELVEVLRQVSCLDVDLHVVPRFFEVGLAPGGPGVEQLWGIPVYRVRRAALQAAAWRVKRIMDVAVAGVALVVASPVLAAAALAVRFSSPGPILFRQRRTGQGGRDIDVLKFRTLTVNSDADITWSVDDDPRQTNVGRWLRRLSVDELPQLWNVLRGDMSIVGPRPERPYYVTRFRSTVAGYDQRHRLPVGLTGLAQVHGLRGDTSIAERARFDNFYIEHWSPWLDVRIMVRTLSTVVRDAVAACRRTRTEVVDDAAEAGVGDVDPMPGMSDLPTAAGETA
jgi:exopolysaccharide biosynthesis polyprenyl glycosylphosphotransferase